MDRKDRISLFGVNMVFLFTGLLLITLGYFLQEKNVYLGLLITEAVLILLPPLIYVLWKRVEVKNVFRLNKIDAKLLGLCALITVCAYPVGLFLNLVGHLILSFFGELMPVPVPVADNVGEYFIGLSVIALLPGIAEEFFFRGLVLRGYEGFGYRKAILISALLFGMFHFNIQNFIGPFFLGLIFGHMVVRTNSIYPAITGHFINNALSVTLAFLAKIAVGQSEQAAAEEVLDLSVLVSGTIVWGMAALIGGYFAVKLFGRLNKATIDVREEPEEQVAPGIKKYIPLISIILIFLVIITFQILYIISEKS